MPWWETPVCRSVRSKAPPSEEGLSFPNVTVKCNRWSCRSLHGDEHLHPQVVLQILEVTAHAWVRSLSTTGYVLLFRQKAAYKERLLCVCWEGVRVQHLSLAQGHASGHGMDGAAFDRSRGTPELQRANTPTGQTSSLPDLKGNSSHPGGPGTHTSC